MEKYDLDPIAVTGVGVVTAASCDWDGLYSTLLKGADCVVPLEEAWAQAPFTRGAPVRDFGAKQIIGAERLRRMNRFSQMAVVAASQAITHAKLNGLSSMGVILGTGLGAIEDTIAFTKQLLQGDPAQANPGLFPNSVMNIATSQVSIELGLQGYNTTVNHKEASAELALHLAVGALRAGHAEALLVGGLDELSEPTQHGYRRLGALSQGRPQPYGKARDGVVLGEGACMVTLERFSQAKARGATVLARIAGSGIAGGENPLVGWSPMQEVSTSSTVEAGKKAIIQALAEAEIEAEEIDFIVGVGAGSPLLDHLEIEVLRQVFCGHAPYLASPHGALGVWMSSGSLRFVLGIAALVRQELFPTLLHGALDPQLSWPNLVIAPLPKTVKTVLSYSHATGGLSVALVLKQGNLHA